MDFLQESSQRALITHSYKKLRAFLHATIIFLYAPISLLVQNVSLEENPSNLTLLGPTFACRATPAQVSHLGLMKCQDVAVFKVHIQASKVYIEAPVLDPCTVGRAGVSINLMSISE